MAFLVSQDHNDDRTIDAIAAREVEIADYQRSVDTIRGALDSEPLVSLEANVPVRMHAIDQLTDPEDRKLAGRFAHRETLRRQLESTEQELEKCQSYFEALVGSLPKDRLDAAVVRFKNRQRG